MSTAEVGNYVGRVLKPLGFTDVMVKNQMSLFRIGEASGDVVIGDNDLAVFHIIRMNEGDFINQP